MQRKVSAWLILFTLVLSATLLLAACQDKAAENKGAKKVRSKKSKAEKTNKETPSSANSETSQTTSSSAGTKQSGVIETSRGKIVFELYSDVAPNTVANFIKLASQGFYNGTKFHRVEPGFVIQGGDPLSKDNDPNNDGTGGPGYNIAAEFNSKKHVTGTVAMARSQDINSAGSQFYITLASQPVLDGKYTIFGQVTQGLDVIQKVQIGDEMKVYIQE